MKKCTSKRRICQHEHESFFIPDFTEVHLPLILRISATTSHKDAKNRP